MSYQVDKKGNSIIHDGHAPYNAAVKELSDNVTDDVRKRNPGVFGMTDNARNNALKLILQKPSKYHNQRTNGYPSKKHAKYAAELELRKAAGEVAYWLEEVPFKLPGFYEDKRGRKRQVRHYLDFLVFLNLNNKEIKLGEDVKVYELVEIKGRDLPMGKLKRKQVEDIYGVHITVI